MNDCSIVKVLGMWHKPKSSLAVAFVNNSISPNAFAPMCVSFGPKLIAYSLVEPASTCP
jgi:hypothetical protein